jgi:hypothetical protein
MVCLVVVSADASADESMGAAVDKGVVDDDRLRRKEGISLEKRDWRNEAMVVNHEAKISFYTLRATGMQNRENLKFVNRNKSTGQFSAAEIFAN